MREVMLYRFVVSLLIGHQIFYCSYRVKSFWEAFSALDNKFGFFYDPNQSTFHITPLLKITRNLNDVIGDDSTEAPWDPPPTDNWIVDMH